MSKKKSVLLVQPMMFVGKGNRVEREVSKGHLCPACSGNGWFWGMDDVGNRLKVVCEACEGKKRLEARITIEWVPDEG